MSGVFNHFPGLISWGRRGQPMTATVRMAMEFMAMLSNFGRVGGAVRAVPDSKAVLASVLARIKGPELDQETVLQTGPRHLQIGTMPAWPLPPGMCAEYAATARHWAGRRHSQGGYI